MLDGLNILREAIRQNPRLRVALGVAALGAVISIVLFLVGGDRELAVIGGVFVVGFMFLLTVFTSITAPDGTTTRPYLATFLVWGISSVFVGTLALFFLSYFFCWPQPFGRSCTATGARVTIVDMDFVSEDGATRKIEGNDAYWVIPQIQRRSSRDFHMDRLDGGVFFVTILVRGFATGPDKSTRVNADVKFATDTKGVLETNNTGTYPSGASWEKRRIPRAIEADKMKVQLRNAAFDYRDGDIPIVVALGCMREDGAPAQKITIAVTVYDEMSGTYAYKAIDGSIVRDAPSAVATQNCSNSQR
jgi:hypothetical protein